MAAKSCCVSMVTRRVRRAYLLMTVCIGSARTSHEASKSAASLSSFSCSLLMPEGQQHNFNVQQDIQLGAKVRHTVHTAPRRNHGFWNESISVKTGMAGVRQAIAEQCLSVSVHTYFDFTDVRKRGNLSALWITNTSARASGNRL